MKKAGDPQAQAVLDFWFDPAVEKLLFEKNDAFDEAVRRALGPLHERAAAGELDHWIEDAGAALALTILLDQVPRNIFRSSPRAFASDEKARAVTYEALKRGHDRHFIAKQRVFFYLPLEHAENLADQERCFALMSALDDAETQWGKYALAHKVIIERFGRFPHRNKALGRETTPEEEAFLKEPNSSF